MNEIVAANLIDSVGYRAKSDGSAATGVVEEILEGPNSDTKYRFLEFYGEFCAGNFVIVRVIRELEPGWPTSIKQIENF